MALVLFTASANNSPPPTHNPFQQPTVPPQQTSSQALIQALTYLFVDVPSKFRSQNETIPMPPALTCC